MPDIKTYKVISNHLKTIGIKSYALEIAQSKVASLFDRLATINDTKNYLEIVSMLFGFTAMVI